MPRSSRLFASLAACIALIAAPAAGSAAAPQPYEISVLLPLSGMASFYATAQQQSLHVVEADANRRGGIGGRPVKFVIHDDTSSPQVDLQLASPIFAAHAPVLLGPTLTAQCNAIMPLVVKNGPVTWCFTPGAHPPANSYVFGFGADTTHVIDVCLRYLKKRGIDRIATMTSTDASGQDGDRGLELAAAKEHVTLVLREHFATSDVTVNAQLARIKAANPQALVVWTTGTPFGTVLRAIKDVGLDVPIVSTNGNLTRAQMKVYAGFLPKDLIFPGAPFLDPSRITDKGVKAVVTTFVDGVKAQGGNPDWGNNNCYDGARLIVAALQKYGPNATAAQVRQFIASQRNWPGINGRYDFQAEPQRGLGDDSVVIVRWDTAKDGWVALSKPGGDPL